MTPADARRPTLASLTGLRFMAALFVFLLHANQFGAPMADDGNPLWREILRQGYAGVPFFFVLSGFILAWNYADRLVPMRGEEVLRFLIARVARIYPVQLLTFTVAAVAIVLRGGVDEAGGGWAFLVAAISQLTLTQSLIPYGTESISFNLPAWSLSDEAVFYAAFPAVLFVLLGVLRGRRPALAAVAIGAVALLAVRVSATPVLGDGPWRLHTFPLFAFVDFLVGVCIGVAFLHATAAEAGDPSPPSGEATVRELVAVGMVAASVVVATRVPFQWAWTVWYLPFMTYAVWVFARGGGLLSRMLATRWWIYLGELSFGLYMWHRIVLDNLAGRFGLHEASLGVVAFAVTMLLCVATYHLVELPARRAIRMRGERWLARRAAGSGTGAAMEGPDDPVGAVPPALAGLAAIACAWAVAGLAVHGVVPATGGVATADGGLLARVLAQWHVSVVLALMLAGYVATTRWHSTFVRPHAQGIGSYLRAIAVHAMPVHLVTLAVALVVVLRDWSPSASIVRVGSSLVAQVTFSQGWIPYGTEFAGFNPGAGYASVVVGLLVALPAVVWLVDGVLRFSWRGLALIATVPVALLAARAMAVGDGSSDLRLLVSYPTFLAIPFLAGMCLALALRGTHGERGVVTAAGSLRELVACAVLVASVVAGTSLPHALTGTAWYVPACALAVATLAPASGIIGRVLASRALSYLGGLSYAAWMWAALVLAIARDGAGPDPGRASVAIAIALAAALATRHLLEPRVRAAVMRSAVPGARTRV